ncbi:MAG: hypothetical protein M9916_00815 [Crocinitomicaceae bacterium]|nr:hypothetical protein [Crocinitomicaceae bacterium]
MSLISEEQRKKIERENTERVNNQLVNTPLIDRWSIVFVLIIVSIILFFIILKKGNIKYAFVPLVASSITGMVIASSSARIRRNEYEGLMYYKGEKDCGLSDTPTQKIDGVMIKRNIGPGTYQERIFKAPNGTDIKIDKEGNVSFIGFGSRFVSKIGGGGYLPNIPDECWK